MISDDEDYILCNEAGCKNKIKKDAWTKIKSEWFFKQDGTNYCPDHIPTWVTKWRKQRAAAKAEKNG